MAAECWAVFSFLCNVFSQLSEIPLIAYRIDNLFGTGIISIF
jgi:hypothetical protein